MNLSQRTILTLIVVLVLDFAFSDENCKEERPSSLAVLGMFDFNDTDSILGFEKGISRHNSLSQKGCVPSLTYSKVFVKNDMSVHELMGVVGSVLDSGTCFMIYASQDTKANVVLDLMKSRKINVITAVREVRIFNYDDFRIINILSI